MSACGQRQKLASSLDVPKLVRTVRAHTHIELWFEGEPIRTVSLWMRQKDGTETQYISGTEQPFKIPLTKSRIRLRYAFIKDETLGPIHAFPVFDTPPMPDPPTIKCHRSADRSDIRIILSSEPSEEPIYTIRVFEDGRLIHTQPGHQKVFTISATGPELQLELEGLTFRSPKLKIECQSTH